MKFLFILGVIILAVVLAIVFIFLQNPNTQKLQIEIRRGIKICIVKKVNSVQ